MQKAIVNINEKLTGFASTAFRTTFFPFCINNYRLLKHIITLVIFTLLVHIDSVKKNEDFP
jgi:hypothetical protein